MSHLFEQYYVSGLWQIPYFNISEPITAHFDAINNRQRFDYYDGLVRIFIIANLLKVIEYLRLEMGYGKKFSSLITNNIVSSKPSGKLSPE
jgi:hypothetical protein